MYKVQRTASVTLTKVDYIFVYLQDTLLVAETTNVGSGSKGNQLKFKERRVFLFEQIILFSEMTEKKRGNIVSAHYLFKNSLKVSI